MLNRSDTLYFSEGMIIQLGRQMGLTRLLPHLRILIILYSRFSVFPYCWSFTFYLSMYSGCYLQLYCQPEVCGLALCNLCSVELPGNGPEWLLKRS